MAVDIRALARAGALRLGTSFTLTCQGRLLLIGCCLIDGAVELTLPDKPRTMAHQVLLDLSDCPLGGQRPWFWCPICKERVAILYAVDMAFGCRHCQNLVYRSQRESALDRLGRSIEKRRVKIGWSGAVTGPTGQKPRGMHWKKYAEIARSCIEKERTYLNALNRKAEKFQRERL
jgi:hypothetical protein